MSLAVLTGVKVAVTTKGRGVEVDVAARQFRESSFKFTRHAFGVLFFDVLTDAFFREVLTEKAVVFNKPALFTNVQGVARVGAQPFPLELNGIDLDSGCIHLVSYTGFAGNLPAHPTQRRRRIAPV